MEIYEGLDVTEILGIEKYDQQAQEEKALFKVIPKSKNPLFNICMGFKPFRTIYFSLNKKESGFPSGISKTDEENLQNVYQIISENFDKRFYITEKAEGMSSTFYTTHEKVWGMRKKVFGVCSRNIKLGKPDNSKYWQIANKFNIKDILMSYPDIMNIQGEIIGTGIQGNIYKVDGLDLLVFNVHIKGKRLSVEDTFNFCTDNKLHMVPILDSNFIPSNHISNNDKQTIVKWFLDYSNGISTLYPTKREGIVCRLIDDPTVSFKVRSPNYLIEHEE